MLVFKFWKKLCIAVNTFESIILLAGACSVNTVDLLVKRSVNVFKFKGGMSGEDAIDPGAPPVCCGAGGAPPLLRLLRELFLLLLRLRLRLRSRSRSRSRLFDLPIRCIIYNT